jgi:hypothetical protein
MGGTDKCRRLIPCVALWPIVLVPIWVVCQCWCTYPGSSAGNRSVKFALADLHKKGSFFFLSSQVNLKFPFTYYFTRVVKQRGILGMFQVVDTKRKFR